MMRATSLSLVLLVACGVGCGTTISAKRVDPARVSRYLTATVLTTGHASAESMNVLRRLGLDERFADDPEEALSELHELALGPGGDPDEMFALAELSFLHAERRNDPRWFRAAALYAWAFLFPDVPAETPNPFDMRLRVAADLYNRGLTSGFRAPKGFAVDIRSGVWELPYGWLYVDLDQDSLRWGDRRFTRFVPVAEVEVKGLANRYRRTGLGAPLAASTEPLAADHVPHDYIPLQLRVDVTALLRVPDARAQIARGAVRAALDVYPGDGPGFVDVQGRRVPLEREPTSALAYTLQQQSWLTRELRAFFQGDFARHVPTRLASITPYEPGRIPVVFVHGTVSSASRWADMLNELFNDPRIRDHFQFWFFTYDSGNPIAYSAFELRQTLTEMVDTLDPEGRDPALHCMVVIGHSQGGLLTKLTAVHLGDETWNRLSKVPLDELDVSEQSRELLRGMFYVEPLPFVTRLVFIATPHRGSFLAGRLGARLVARFIRLPRTIARTVEEVLERDARALRGGAGSAAEVPTALHNMTPGNRFIRATENLRTAEGVHTHSIIPVSGDGPVETGNDGVVEYESAHLDWADSELVVRSTHSTQGEPATINEVRRILLLQLQSCPVPAAPAGTPAPPGAQSLGADVSSMKQ